VHLIIDNDQRKKSIEYTDYVDAFLADEKIGDFDNLGEKIAIYNLAREIVLAKKLDTKERFDGYSVLDMRAKDGRFVEFIKSKGKTSLGLDFVKAWIPYAEEKHRDVIYMHPENTKFDAQSWDIVLNYRIAGHVSDNEKLITETARITNKYFIIVIDDILGDKNMRFTSTRDIIHYKRWFDKLTDFRPVYFGKNVISKVPGEFIFIYLRVQNRGTL
jgi:2-polyprenyl-3-methyl-5-hydroxy-6-metoxy-1,4-benzoquinol methylase